MRIACAQLEARELEDAPAALADALAAIAAAGRAGADLCVLPEGTYPGYVLGSEEAARAALDAGPDPVAAVGAAAREAGVMVVAGLVVEAPDGEGLWNAAVLLGRDGAVRATAGKRFLWHFDRLWFQPGCDPPVVEGVGMLICADGRLPEIAAGLVRRGARLICDPTAWVTLDSLDDAWNVQAEFMLRVRAMENGVPAAAASKVGVEGGVAAYCGRSQVVAADGTVVAMASGTGPELLVAEVEVPDRPLPPRPRVPRAGAGGEPEERARRRPVGTGPARVAVVTSNGLVARLAGHGCRVIVGPDGVVSKDGVAVAEVRGDEALIPGPAREAALDGCEVLVWTAAGVRPDLVEAVARTRAAENRVFVACWRPPAGGGPLIVAPSGRVLARSPRPGIEFAVAADCLLDEAAVKEMAPGTDVFDALAHLPLDG